MIRIGTVADINSDYRTVRVAFAEADNLVSDWLKVISTPPVVTAVTDEETDLTVEAWMPREGDTVICLYDDGPNADGYVIGGIAV